MCFCKSLISSVQVKPNVWSTFFYHKMASQSWITHVTDLCCMCAWPAYNVRLLLFEFKIDEKKLCKQLLRTLNIFSSVFSYNSVIQDQCQLSSYLIPLSSCRNMFHFMYLFHLHSAVLKCFEAICWTYRNHEGLSRLKKYREKKRKDKEYKEKETKRIEQLKKTEFSSRNSVRRIQRWSKRKKKKKFFLQELIFLCQTESRVKYTKLEVVSTQVYNGEVDEEHQKSFKAMAKHVSTFYIQEAIQNELCR